MHQHIVSQWSKPMKFYCLQQASQRQGNSFQSSCLVVPKWQWRYAAMLDSDQQMLQHVLVGQGLHCGPSDPAC